MLLTQVKHKLHSKDFFLCTTHLSIGGWYVIKAFVPCVHHVVTFDESHDVVCSASDTGMQLFSGCTRTTQENTFWFCFQCVILLVNTDGNHMNIVQTCFSWAALWALQESDHLLHGGLFKLHDIIGFLLDVWWPSSLINLGVVLQLICNWFISNSCLFELVWVRC